MAKNSLLKTTFVLIISLAISENVFAKPKKIKTGDKLATDGVVYVGNDQDKLSAGQQPNPDSILDLHFKMRHVFNDGDELLDVILSHVDEKGITPGWRTSLKENRWLLVVEKNGKPLNSGAATTLGKLTGPAELDIFAGDNQKSTYSSKGKTYQIDLLIRDAAGAERLVSGQVKI